MLVPEVFGATVHLGCSSVPWSGGRRTTPAPLSPGSGKRVQAQPQPRSSAALVPSAKLMLCSVLGHAAGEAARGSPSFTETSVALPGRGTSRTSAAVPRRMLLAW